MTIIGQSLAAIQVVKMKNSTSDRVHKKDTEAKEKGGRKHSTLITDITYILLCTFKTFVHNVIIYETRQKVFSLYKCLFINVIVNYSYMVHNIKC